MIKKCPHCGKTLRTDYDTRNHVRSCNERRESSSYTSQDTSTYFGVDTSSGSDWSSSDSSSSDCSGGGGDFGGGGSSGDF